ncbi:MAG TPA: zinc-binding dehydrogenase, partial [Acidobacteriaceae bacterium]|nr:zinc-binding dehydrogenase [Acidobacteriaceae bacterium]
ELPSTLSDVEAAAAWMQYATAYGALVEIARVGPGDVVIIPAASSSVGLAAIQIVHAQGGIAIAATRTSAKKDRLLGLGADHVIATAEEDLPARVHEITSGKLARVVFDPVGGSYVETLAAATGQDGIIFLYGVLSGQPTVYPMSSFGKGVSLVSYTLLQMLTPERLPRMKQYIYDRLADGTFHPEVDRTFPLDQVVEAYTHLESNQQIGKIVITL